MLKKNFKILLSFWLSILSAGTIPCQKTLELIYAKNSQGPWELKSEFLSYIKDIFKSNTFIETGTYLGFTAKHAAKIFDQVKTIELSRQIFENAKNSLKSETNVVCYFGDSANLLGDMIQNSTGNLLFWLDGHYSGEGTGFGGITSPLIQELKIIKATGRKNSVIMIDDIRLFNKAANQSHRQDVNGYPLLEEIYNLLININPNYNIVLLGDILLAYEKYEEVKVSDVLKSSTLLRINPEAPISELIKAEQTISKASGIELETIHTLYNLFCIHEHRNSNALYKENGIGSHFALCYILTLLNDNKRDQALELLNGPLTLAIDKKYIDGLITRIKSNQI